MSISNWIVTDGEEFTRLCYSEAMVKDVIEEYETDCDLGDAEDSLYVFRTNAAIPFSVERKASVDISL